MYLWEKIADVYIKDTELDGEKFCGCRSEDCELFDDIKECRKCLKKMIESEEI